MSTASTIANYIRHNRSLGNRFVAEEAILSQQIGKSETADTFSAAIQKVAPGNETLIVSSVTFFHGRLLIDIYELVGVHHHMGKLGQRGQPKLS